MVRHHHRLAPAVALTLALAAAAPASARLELNPPASSAAPSTPASTNLCSEVCGASGYTAATQPPGASAGRGAALPHDPRPRAQALAGAATGSGSSTTASSGFSGPRSEVVSAGGYSNPSAPQTVVRVSAPSGGFDWGDAAIGAGGAVALTMLLIGGVLRTTNIRHRGTGSSAQSTT
jgi:hypothetical protein